MAKRKRWTKVCGKGVFARRVARTCSPRLGWGRARVENRLDTKEPVNAQVLWHVEQFIVGAGGEVAGGDSYGSRWCERQRATTGYLFDVRISTPAGVADVWRRHTW